MHLLADSTFHGFQMDGININVLPPQGGLDYAARLIRRKQLIIKSDVLFVCLGRADVEEGLSGFQESLLDLHDSVLRFNENTKIICSGPIPRGTDGRRQVARCVNAGKVVKSFCATRQRSCFTPLAMEFITRRGVNLVLMLPQGASAMGKAVLKSYIRKGFN